LDRSARALIPESPRDCCLSPGEWADRGEISLKVAAKIIRVTPVTALRMIKRGDLKGR
jgi:hypothetical protein